MKLFDIPYNKNIWEQYKQKATTNKSLFGKYLARMKLGNLRPLTFEDTIWFKEK